jgi:hypothetical protein
MYALGFFKERQKRIKFAHEKITERLETVSFNGSTVRAALKAYIALCEREEARLEKALAPDQALRRVPNPEAAPLTGDESLAGPSPEGETDLAAEANQVSEQGATPVVGQGVENPEPTAEIILQ